MTDQVASDDDAPWDPLDFETLITLREGNRKVVYLDSRGKPTGGRGHLILPSDNMKVGQVIPDAVNEAWFKHDTAGALEAATEEMKQAGIIEPTFLPYLGSVNFQLGLKWTASWPHTWAMIVAGNYEQAADSLEGTPWQKQTPVRVQDFQDALVNLPPKGTTLS